MNADAMLKFLADEAVTSEYAGDRRRADVVIKVMKAVISAEKAIKSALVKKSNELFLLDIYAGLLKANLTARDSGVAKVKKAFSNLKFSEDFYNAPSRQRSQPLPPRKLNEPPWAKPTHRIVKFRPSSDPLAEGSRPVPVYERNPPPLPLPKVPRKNPWWDFEHGFEHNLGHYGGNVGEVTGGIGGALGGGVLGGTGGTLVMGPVGGVTGAAALSAAGGYYGAQSVRGTGINTMGYLGRKIDEWRGHKPTKADLAVRQGLFTDYTGNRSNFGKRDNWDYVSAIPTIVTGNMAAMPIRQGLGLEKGIVSHQAKVQAAKELLGQTVHPAGYTGYDHPFKPYYSSVDQAAIERGEITPTMIYNKAEFNRNAEPLYPGQVHTPSDARLIEMNRVARDTANQAHVNPDWDRNFNPSVVEYYPFDPSKGAYYDLQDRVIQDYRGHHYDNLNARLDELESSQVGYHEHNHGAASKVEDKLTDNGHAHHTKDNYINTRVYERGADEFSMKALKREIEEGIRPKSDMDDLLRFKEDGTSSYFYQDEIYENGAVKEWKEMYANPDTRQQALNILGEKLNAIVTNTTDLGYQSAFPHWYNTQKGLNFLERQLPVLIKENPEFVRKLKRRAAAGAGATGVVAGLGLYEEFFNNSRDKYNSVNGVDVSDYLKHKQELEKIK
jgi:hypothetical protein